MSHSPVLQTYNSVIVSVAATDIVAGTTNNLPPHVLILNNTTGQLSQGNPSGSPVVLQGGTGGSGVTLDNFSATSAPTPNDDSTDKYSVGSRWIDLTVDESYICVDNAAGAAVWSKTTVGTIAEVAGLQTALDLKASVVSLTDASVAANFSTISSTAANLLTAGTDLNLLTSSGNFDVQSPTGTLPDGGTGTFWYAIVHTVSGSGPDTATQWAKKWFDGANTPNQPWYYRVKVNGTWGTWAKTLVNNIATSDIVNNAVTYAKIQNVSATDRLLGRGTGGAGVVEEIICTPLARSLIAGSTATAMRTTLGAAPAAFSGARVTKSATQSIPDSVDTVVTFTTETYDTNGYHDIAVNNSRLTAPSAGYYRIGLRTEWASNNVGQRVVSYAVNGGTNVEMLDKTATTGVNWESFSTELHLNSGDYVTFLAFQSSGAALNITAGTFATISYLGS